MMSDAMNYHGVKLTAEQIAHFCQRHGVVRLSLFGSILRDDFGPESDVDVLVEFDGPSPSLLELGGMQAELSQMLGRFVDLKTWGFLSQDIREHVAKERRIEYAAA
jgi:predicted nucleotidyltransferase